MSWDSVHRLLVNVVVLGVVLLSDLVECQYFRYSYYRFYTRYIRYMRRPTYQRETVYVNKDNVGDFDISSASDSNTTTGQVVGGAVGGVLAAVVIVVVVIICWRRRNKKHTTTKTPVDVGGSSKMEFAPYQPPPVHGHMSTSSAHSLRT